MDFFLILISWLVLSPLLTFFYHHQFLFFLLLCGGFWLYRRRHPKATQSQETQPRSTDIIDDKLIDLLILRAELARQRDVGNIDLTQYEKVLQKIDTACDTSLAIHYIRPDSQRWRDGRDAAWQLLMRHQAGAIASPPWRTARELSQEQLPLPFVPRATSETRAPSTNERLTAPIVPPTVQVPAPVVVPPVSYETAEQLQQPSVVSTSGSVPISASVSPTPVVSVSDSGTNPISVVEPSVLERTLQTISGWPALLVPFLVQNILWFICGLCFVAGSTSLIASTSGKTNTLAVSLVLLTYSGFLLWVGYRLCRNRPELTTSGTVLLALGVLLIPLNIASVVRLVAAAQTGPWIALGSCLVAVELFGFYYATMLVSGVMDRFLQGRHPQLFLALTAVQVMVPLLSWYPSWVTVATTHCVLLGFLAYSVWQFTHDWLHSILGEHRKVGFYAIGTLVYAALVSWVHITWGSIDSGTLPSGYASPFLMAICGMLFYVDAQLKQWTKRYAFLSHVSFLLYGLSIIALLLSIDSPQARTITLCLALFVYSVVVWQYLTFVPLVLLLGCTGGLYYTLFLQQLHPQWHLLTSLPGLIGLLSANRWLQRHRETSLTATCFQGWFGVTLLLSLWSLGHAQPGVVAFTTAWVTMGLLYYALGSAPTAASATKSESPNLRHSPWLYVVMALGALAIAYSPQWSPSSWTVQTVSGLILLSVIWIGSGLHLYHQGSTEQANQTEVLLNSAFLNLSLALLLISTIALPNFTQHRLPPVLLLAIGSVLLWMSLALRVRGLFYGVLGLWGLAGIIVKWTYFPHPGSGAVEMTLALLTWGILWWLEHESEESRDFRKAALTARARLLPSLRLFWPFPLVSESTYAILLRQPLQQTMVFFWLIGIVRIAGAFLTATIGWGWTSAMIMGMVGAVLGAGYFRIPLFTAVAVWLGLGAWLALTFLTGFTHAAELGLAGVLFSFVIWKLSSIFLHRARAAQLAAFLHLTGNRDSIEAIGHWTTIVSGIWCVGITLLFVGVFTASGVLFVTLLSLIGFLMIAGWQYHRQAHSYLALAVVILTALLSYSWSVLPLHNSLHSLLRDHHVGLLAAATGLVFWATAWELTIQRDRLHTEFISRLFRLYHTPLCHAALFLSVFAVNQQLALAWLAPLQNVTVLAVATLLLASVVLFSASFTLGHLSLQIAALLSTSLVVLWGEALLVHPQIGVTLWLGGKGSAGQWLTLSLVVTGFALLAHHCRQLPERQLYARPLSRAAIILYTWALLGTLLFHFNAPLRPDLWVSLSLLALAFSLFPLLQPLTKASAIRGVTLPLLSYPLLITILVWTPFAQQLNVSALLWGFLLWAAANFVLPRWNVKHPHWAVTTDIWPWFGLLAVGLSLTYAFISPLLIYSPAHQQPFNILLQAGHLTAGAAYCFLMLRNSTWRGFPWVGTFLLTRVGALLLTAWWAAPRSFVPEVSVILLPLHPPIGELLWLNLLLLVVPWWNRNGKVFAAKLGWQEHHLPYPFLLLPAGYFILRLAHLVVLVSSDMTSRLFPTGEVQWLGLFVFAATLTCSFLHLWRWHQRSWVAHALLLSFLYTLFIASTACLSPIFHLPFFLALWSAALLAVHSLWEKRPWGGESTAPLRHILSQWVEPSLIAAIVALLVFSVPLYEQLLALLVLIDTAAILGWRRQQRHWLIVAAAMSLVFLHDWPLLWVPFAQVTLLLPWYALQMAVVAWLLQWMSQAWQRSEQILTDESVASRADVQTTLALHLSWAGKIAVGIAVIEWGAHLVSMFFTLAAGHAPQWLIGRGDVYAALLAAALLLGFGIRQVGIRQRPAWIYGVAVFASAVGVYARLVLVGLAPASAWDTTALLVSAYAMLFLHHFVRLAPLLHIVMIMPLFLIALIPWQLASAHAGTTLIAAAALYFLTYRESDRGLPLYLAFASVNAALYLWIPMWAAHYQVVQLYLTPAAFSALLLAHLHRHELSPHVLNGVRLAATATLYVSATSDMFFHPGVGMFLVALTLSLVGVLVGIASRIRAFLYTGMISLVCNIGWQLLMLFPEQRLSQAVILLVLAGVLAGMMTWFNIQREEILRRVRVFRSDLETWA